MCSWHYPAPEQKVNKNRCSWLLRTFAKLAYTPNCSHVGLLSWSDKRGGYALFKICLCFSTGRIYEWDNGPLMVNVAVRVYMCVYVCDWHSIEGQYHQQKSSFLHSLIIFSFLLRTKQESCHHLFEHPHMLKGLLVLMLSSLSFVKPCLEVCAWHCTMSAAGQMKYWGRGSISVISCLCSTSVECTQPARGYEPLWCVIVCVCMGLQVYLLQCAVMTHSLHEEEASGRTSNSILGLFWELHI